MNVFDGGRPVGTGKISPSAVMECKICWTPYDPACGDAVRKIKPGTPFTHLPPTWSCPKCEAPIDQFTLRKDPGTATESERALLARSAEALTRVFAETRRDARDATQILNPTLSFEVVGLRLHEGRPLGMVVTPWFMSFVWLPAEGEDWSALDDGASETVTFPSGAYTFTHHLDADLGGYKLCKVFSPMSDFHAQGQAVDMAHALLQALFDPEMRKKVDEPLTPKPL